MRTLLLLFLSCIATHSALFFNGSSGRLYFSNGTGSAPFTSGTSMSIGAWIYRTGTNYTPIIFANNAPDSSASRNYEFAIDNTCTNCFTFAYRSAGTPNFNQNIWSSSPNAVTGTNIWVHVGVTFQWGISISPIFYVNGVPITAGSWTTGTGTGSGATSPNYVAIANDLQSTWFLGTVGELTMWYNVLLSPQEMLTAAQSRMKYGSMQVRPRDVGAYWSMDQLPNFVTASGTNSVLNVGRDGVKNVNNLVPANITPLGSPVSLAERVCSYPPNE